MRKKVTGFNITEKLNTNNNEEDEKCPCNGTITNNVSNLECSSSSTCPTWTGEALQCIEFEGEERYLPAGWRGMPGVTLENMFLNWGDIDNPLFLEVNTSYIENVNDIYNGRGILLMNPLNGDLLTLKQWQKKFKHKDYYNGILLLGIKEYPKRSKSIYTKSLK